MKKTKKFDWRKYWEKREKEREQENPETVILSVVVSKEDLRIEIPLLVPKTRDS